MDSGSLSMREEFILRAWRYGALCFFLLIIIYRDNVRNCTGAELQCSDELQRGVLDTSDFPAVLVDPKLILEIERWLVRNRLVVFAEQGELLMTRRGEKYLGCCFHRDACFRWLDFIQKEEVHNEANNEASGGNS